MNKGDIVLVLFPFTDLSGTKNRPALVLIKSNYDVTVCFITSRLTNQEDLDVVLEPTVENGIKKKSVIRLRKITTLDLNLVLGRIGSLNQSEQHIVDKNLKKMPGLE